MSKEHSDSNVEVLNAEPRAEIKEPSLYQVVLCNDDYTPMDFVIEVLQRFFSHNLEQATQIMLMVHNKGKGVCGVYTKDVAETKVFLVNEYSKEHEHPLLCTMEKA